MASREETSQSLKFKLLVFKVSIHCEGCKKKVKKILANIAGVYDTEIDARQHKVTVKASTDAETILRRLEKSGMHASIWPSPDKKPGYQSSEDGGASFKKKDATESSEKEEKEKASPSPSESNSPAVTPAKPSNSKESKIESLAKTPAEPQKLDAYTGDKIQKPVARAGEADNAKGGGKKKEGKAQKEKEREKESGGTNSGSATVNPTPPPMFSYPTHQTSPPQPAYVMTYNTAQPSHIHTYYAPPPPMPIPQGHVYMPYPPPPEFHYGSMDLSSLVPMQLPPPPDMFSDDNPNACHLM